MPGMAQAATARRRRAAPRRPAPSRSTSGIRWDRVGRVGLLAVLGTIVLLYVSPAKHWIEQSRTAGEQNQELRDLTHENRDLRHRVHELRTPGALEGEARRLGMVRRGERAYVIENLKNGH
jgi:cell division protein FtsB